MQKSCEEIAGMLVNYADGQLSPSESGKVAEHLAKCERCRSTFEALEKSLHLAGVIWADGLADIETVSVPTLREAKRSYWIRYAAVAASILIVAAGSILWRMMMRPAEKQPTFAEIERAITESGSAARLLAAADLLARYPDAEPIVKKQYHYIVEVYPETPAAAKAKLRIQ